MIFFKLQYIGLFLFVIFQASNAFVLLTANFEDVKKIARKLFSEPVAEKIVEFIAKATGNFVPNVSEENEENASNVEDVSDNEIESFNKAARQQQTSKRFVMQTRKATTASNAPVTTEQLVESIEEELNPAVSVYQNKMAEKLTRISKRTTSTMGHKEAVEYINPASDENLRHKQNYQIKVPKGKLEISEEQQLYNTKYKHTKLRNAINPEDAPIDQEAYNKKPEIQYLQNQEYEKKHQRHAEREESYQKDRTREIYNQERPDNSPNRYKPGNTGYRPKEILRENQNYPSKPQSDNKYQAYKSNRESQGYRQHEKQYQSYKERDEDRNINQNEDMGEIRDNRDNREMRDNREIRDYRGIRDNREIRDRNIKDEQRDRNNIVESRERVNERDNNDRGQETRTWEPERKIALNMDKAQIQKARQDYWSKQRNVKPQPQAVNRAEGEKKSVEGPVNTIVKKPRRTKVKKRTFRTNSASPTDQETSQKSLIDIKIDAEPKETKIQKKNEIKTIISDVFNTNLIGGGTGEVNVKKIHQKPPKKEENLDLKVKKKANATKQNLNIDFAPVIIKQNNKVTDPTDNIVMRAGVEITKTTAKEKTDFDQYDVVQNHTPIIATAGPIILRRLSEKWWEKEIPITSNTVTAQ